MQNKSTKHMKYCQSRNCGGVSLISASVKYRIGRKIPQISVSLTLHRQPELMIQAEKSSSGNLTFEVTLYPALTKE